jgi:hypothetical protein
MLTFDRVNCLRHIADTTIVPPIVPHLAGGAAGSDMFTFDGVNYMFIAVEYELCATLQTQISPVGPAGCLGPLN